LVMLVVFGIILQLGSAAMFVWLQRPLTDAGAD